MLFVKLEFSLRSWKCISWRNCCLKALSPIAWQRERNQLKSLGGYPEWKWLLMSGVANYLLSCCWVWLFHQTVVRNVKDVVFITLWPFLFFWRKTFVCASRVEIFSPQGALRLKLPELDLLGWNYVDSLQSTETKDAPFLRRTWRRRKWLRESSVRTLPQPVLICFTVSISLVFLAIYYSPLRTTLFLEDCFLFSSPAIIRFNRISYFFLA